MKKITQETINRIQEEVSIIDVMENYTRVVKKGYGNAYTGFCPFHNDVRNPSLSIDADRKIFHCFTCSEGGNLFQFIQKMEGINFADSVKLLAEKNGIPVIYENPDDTDNEEDKVSFYKILKDAEQYFIEQLPSAKEGTKYLADRNFSQETINQWGIGWAQGGKNLYNYLSKKGYSNQDLVDSGLIAYNEDKKEYKDVFYSRIVFPIRDVLSRPIGFGGRTLDPDGKPKYLNSKENPIFHKRKTLFGMDMARKPIQEKDEVIVTEGYVDTIMMHQYGIKNVVAALGTAFTDDHILILSRMTKNIYLSLDADKAGRTAAKRVIDLLGNTDASVYVIEIPLDMAKDPDEFLQKYSVEDFMAVKDKAVSIQKFIAQSIIEEHNLNSPNAKDRAYKNLVEFIKKYQKTFTMFQGIEVCDYIVNKMGMPMSGYELYQSIIKNNKTINQKTTPAVVTDNLIDMSLELNLIRLLLDWPSFIDIIKSGIKEDYFTIEETKVIYKTLITQIEEQKDINQLNFKDKDIEKIWNKFLITHPSASLTDRQAEQSIKKSINALKRLYLEKRLEVLEQKDSQDLEAIFNIKMELAKIPRIF